jgi:hypothetical protein
LSMQDEDLMKRMQTEQQHQPRTWLFAGSVKCPVVVLMM